jgi:hypothetical protein
MSSEAIVQVHNGAVLRFWAIPIRIARNSVAGEARSATTITNPTPSPFLREVQP